MDPAADGAGPRRAPEGRLCLALLKQGELSVVYSGVSRPLAEKARRPGTLLASPSPLPLPPAHLPRLSLPSLRGSKRERSGDTRRESTPCG